MLDNTWPPLKLFLKDLRGRYLSLNVNQALSDIEANKKVTILCLHSVGTSQNPCNPSLRIDLFRELLQFIVQNYQVITFGDLEARVSYKKPPLILSFDDGYEDFIDFVAPELDRIGIKANLNIIPWCIQSGKPPLNVLAQDFIGSAPSDLLSLLKVPGYQVPDFTGKRLQFGLMISNFLKNLCIKNQLEIYGELESQFYRFGGFKPTKMLDSNQINQISGVVEFGAHSYHHASMTSETDNYFSEDLENCKKYFAEALNLDVEIYAFPNGYYSYSNLDIARKRGFKHLLLTEADFSTAYSSVHPRFPMYGDTLGELIARMQKRW